MFLFKNDFQCHSTRIRGVRYAVFSFYSGDDLIFDRVGKLIKNSFETTDTVQIPKPDLLGLDIAIANPLAYPVADPKSTSARH